MLTCITVAVIYMGDMFSLDPSATTAQQHFRHLLPVCTERINYCPKQKNQIVSI